MKDIKAKILSNEKFMPGYFKMILDAPGIAREVTPGQFVQIRCNVTTDPLLRRPFSIHSAKPSKSQSAEKIEILYEVIGKGTKILSGKEKGDFLSVLGPLGTGFTLPMSNPRSRAVLIAGGMGVAPLVFLAGELAKQKIKTIVLIGAKTKKLILCEKDFRKTGAEVHVATDDGARGFKGFVSGLFEKILRTTGKGQRTTVYACGPEAMLKRIAEISEENRLKCQVSVEEKMACGIGACLGCVVKVKPLLLNKLACKDGPVFDAENIVWR